MRSIGILCVLGLSAVAPLYGATAEEVIAKHVEARGGRAAWDGIETMKITGNYTSFSITSPFTLHRQRDYRFHMDYQLGEWPRVDGFDGETAWRAGGRGGAQPLLGLQRSILMHEVDFATPLFDYADRGLTVELLGSTDIEGQETIALRLTHPDESTETWYLDPETHLELARDTTGVDYTGPVPQRTFFDDFRPVGDVTIPHFTDTQWLTRSRMMQIEKIEINGSIDETVFLMPPRAGMAELQPMIGTWSVTSASRSDPDADWEEAERVSTVENTLSGGLLREHFETDGGALVMRTLSFDRTNQAYTLTQINESSARLDVYRGALDESGRLVVSNLETGTARTDRSGATVHGRFSILEIGDGGFRVEYESSTDGGESWFLAAKATYRRQGG